MNRLNRCSWCENDESNRKYHDEEWGTPNHDDRVHFEFLTLESMQTGLSWLTIIRKRENFRKALDNFEPEKIAAYNESKIGELLLNKEIIRNRKKLEGIVNNAKKFIEIQKEFGSFDNYIWKFVDGKPVNNQLRSLTDMPITSELAQTISADLKRKGFKFVGPIVIYCFLQTVGIVNDHLVSCFRYNELINQK